MLMVLFGMYFSLVAVTQAHAYLDPGLGSYIWQLLIAFLIGASFVFRTFFQKIGSFLKNFFSSKKGK